MVYVVVHAGSDGQTDTVNFSIGKITKFFSIGKNIFCFFAGKSSPPKPIKDHQK